MITSNTGDKPVAIIYGGIFNGKILYINNEKIDIPTPVMRSDDQRVCQYCGRDFTRSDNTKRHELICPLKKREEFLESYVNKRGYSRQISLNDYISDDSRSFFIPNGDAGILQLVPSIAGKSSETVDTLYIAGPSGSGKSTFINNYCIELIKMLPSYKIVLFSRYTNDISFSDELKKKVIPIELNEELLKSPIDIEKELKGQGCICIFDDISKSANKKVTEYVRSFMNELLENYRSHNSKEKDCYVIITNHLVCDNQNTKLAHYESKYIVLFPNASEAQNKRCLKTYIGMSDKQANFALKLNSRWICIHNRFPKFVLHEKGMYML